MKTTTMLLGATVLALGVGFTNPVQANPEYAGYIERIDLAPAGGIGIHVVLKNTSENKHVSAVKIQPVSDTLKIALEGHVKCEKDKDTNFDKATAYFGPVDLFVDAVVDTGALYDATYHPDVTTWNGVGGGKWVTEGGNAEDFSVPLASIRQGDPAVRFDPVAELDKKLQAHLQQGKSKAAFYQKEQFITVERPVSLAGWCRKTVSVSQAISKPGYKTVTVPLHIRYEADPAVNDTPVLNAQIKDGGVQGDIAQNNLPFKLAEAVFQPNMPHYTGKCAPQQDPKIRFSYKGAGGKGKIRFSVKDNGGSVYGTQDIAYDSADGVVPLDFFYPLTAKLASTPAWKEANKTFTHNLSISAKVMDQTSDVWGPWQDFGTAQWKHRCEPQVQVQIGGGVGGMGGGFQSQEEAAKPTLRPTLGMKDPAPGLNIQAAPVEPKAEMKLKAPEQTPKPALLLPAIQK